MMNQVLLSGNGYTFTHTLMKVYLMILYQSNQSQSAAEKCGNVHLRFNHELMDVNLSTGQMVLMNVETKRVFDNRVDLIIGCDGSNSVVRQKMMETPGFNISQV